MSLSLGHFIALASGAAWQNHSFCIFEVRIFGFILFLKMILRVYLVSRVEDKKDEIHGVSESGK